MIMRYAWAFLAVFGIASAVQAAIAETTSEAEAGVVTPGRKPKAEPPLAELIS